MHRSKAYVQKPMIATDWGLTVMELDARNEKVSGRQPPFPLSSSFASPICPFVSCTSVMSSSRVESGWYALRRRTEDSGLGKL
jgi:hypothetical protein